MSHPTERFSNKVQDYIQYRPSYPKELLKAIEQHTHLDRDDVVVDIGSGTGLLTELFLKNGNFVYSLEPNDSMREAAEEILKNYEDLVSLNRTAEDTKLPKQWADLIVAAQAFHWFDSKACQKEWKRILKPEGFIALIWNERAVTQSEFMQAYEELIKKFGTDYDQVKGHQVDEAHIQAFFQSDEFICIELPNKQFFDLESLKGRLSSASYIPDAKDPRYTPMMQQLEKIFNQFAISGQVEFLYQCKTYIIQNPWS